MSKQDDWFAKAQEEILKDQRQDEVEAEAQVWEPESGDLLRGEFVKAVPYWKTYREGPALNWRAYVKDLDDDDEPLVLVFATSTVIKNELVNAAPAQGSLIAIQYFGMEETANGRSYHKYKVRTKASDTKYWAQLRQEAANTKPQPEVQVQQTAIGPDTVPF